MRLIDADGLKVRLKEYCIDGDKEIKKYYEIMGIDDCVDKAPTVERRKGKWIAKAIGSKTTWYVCSECGRSVVDDTGYDVAEAYPFCHCGADMRKEEE